MTRHMTQHRMMHRFSWAIIALATCALLAPWRGAAAQFGFGLGPQIVYDPTAVGKLVTQLSRQAQQVTLAQQQLQAQITALKKLSAPPWRDVRSAMAQADALIRQGEAIAYSLANVDAAFQATFTGTSVAGSAPTAEHLQALRTLATLRGVLDAAARSVRDLPTGVARLEQAKQQMASVQGHEQALELNGAVGVYTAEQLTVVSQQLAALTNADAVYFAHEVNERAQAQANARAFLAALGRIPAARPGFSYRIR